MADYAIDLCAALEVDYAVEIVTESVPPGTFVTSRSRAVSPADFLQKQRDHYDRVLYQIGNSRFHIYACELLHRVPGDVVLHDIVLSDLLTAALCGSEELDHVTMKDARALHDVTGTAGYSIEFITQRAKSVIVHSDHAKSLISSAVDPRKIHSAPQVHHIVRKDREISRSFLDISNDKLLVCSFGIVSPTKLHHLIAHAADVAYRKGARELVLAFVGDAPGKYGQSLRRHARNAPYEFRITGRISKDLYEDYLAAADIAVQLRGSSKGESSRATLDTMSSGIPTITNPVGSMAELPTDCAYAIAASPNQGQLGDAIMTLRSDKNFRLQLGDRARSYVEKRHSATSVRSQLRNIFALEPDSEDIECGRGPLCIDATELAQIADPEIRSATFRSIACHHQETGAAPRGIVFGIRPPDGAPPEIRPLSTDGAIIRSEAFCRPRRACSMIDWRPPPRGPEKENAEFLAVTSPEEYDAISQAIRSISLDVKFKRISLGDENESPPQLDAPVSTKKETTILISSSAALSVSYLIGFRRHHTGIIFCEDSSPLRLLFGPRAIYAPANISFAASCTMLILRSQLNLTADNA
ncbi:glycosyltransferase [Brevundimonas sp.]|uniref:glycosyltransferase n=1 Tax=Brevundimonas sp. TaxID=1871086 RepID=UPI0028AF4D93|nr:glycosyltransferase [Brevundimonas sp.]